jgi:hypothetical protein
MYSYRTGRLLHGVIYFHRISDIRMAETLRRSFSLFTKICGDDALKNVVIVTNMWNRVTEEEGNARQRELETDNRFFKPALNLGAIITRHTNTGESALNILYMFLNKHPMPLRIQSELVDSGKRFLETEVAQAVNTSSDGQMEEAIPHKSDSKMGNGTRSNLKKATPDLKEEPRRARARLTLFQKSPNRDVGAPQEKIENVKEVTDAGMSPVRTVVHYKSTSS